MEGASGEALMRNEAKPLSPLPPWGESHKASGIITSG